MPELVGQHGLELGEIERGDQPEPDHQVLADGPEEAQERARIKDACVDVGREEDLARHGAPRVAAEPAQEGEEARLIGLGDLHETLGGELPAAEEPFEEEQKEHHRACDGAQVDDDGLAGEPGHLEHREVHEVARAPDQPEVDHHEEQQRHQHENDAHLVRGRGLGGRRGSGRARGIEIGRFRHAEHITRAALSPGRGASRSSVVGRRSSAVGARRAARGAIHGHCCIPRRDVIAVRVSRNFYAACDARSGVEGARDDALRVVSASVARGQNVTSRPARGPAFGL
jgi:hypothetical protein